MSGTIHRRAKQDGFSFFFKEENYFQQTKATVPGNAMKATKFGIKVFRDMYFYIF